jgi:hypothetical protein
VVGFRETLSDVGSIREGGDCKKESSGFQVPDKQIAVLPDNSAIAEQADCLLVCVDVHVVHHSGVKVTGWDLLQFSDCFRQCLKCLKPALSWLAVVVIVLALVRGCWLG